MTLEAAACHGRLTFGDRPPAGTGPWAWWQQSFSRDVPIYSGMPDRANPTIWAMTTWTDQGAYVTFHYKLTPLQQTMALAHEMHHLAVGGVCSRRCAANEAKVVRATARWLIPDVVTVAEKMQRMSAGAAARELGVLRSVLWERLWHATSSERAAIDEVMAQPPTWTSKARAARKSVGEAA
jgi:hypothetical protein